MARSVRRVLVIEDDAETADQLVPLHRGFDR